MKLKAIAPLLVAIVLGLFAARLAMKVIANGVPKIAQSTQTGSMVVASHDVNAGATLTDADLVVTKVDPANIPAGAYTETAGPINRVAKIALVKGQAILPNVLADDGSGYGVAATLPKGMRAITVDINDTTGVAGFIEPQSKVDVVTTLQTDGKSVSRTILESVTVLAVGTRTNPNAAPGDPQGQAKTITLLVKPKDAERIELANSIGRLRMVLRNGRDPGKVDDTTGMTVAELKGQKDVDPFATPTSPITQTAFTPAPSTQPTPPLKTTWTVEIIKAGQSSSQTFDIAAKQPAATPESDPAATSVTELDHK